MVSFYLLIQGLGDAGDLAFARERVTVQRSWLGVPFTSAEKIYRLGAGLAIPGHCH